jgi:hypothetical protein
VKEIIQVSQAREKGLNSIWEKSDRGASRPIQGQLETTNHGRLDELGTWTLSHRGPDYGVASLG